MHELWHVLVLVGTLLGVASAALLVVVPTLFPQEPKGYRSLEPALRTAALVAVALLLVEWVGIH